MVQWQRIKEKWHKDGWLFIALAAAVLLCLAMSAMESAPAGQTDDEARLSRVLSAIEGAGQVDVAVFYESSQDQSASRPVGAVVVAQGADDIAVRLRLIRAVCTLLGIDSSQVEIFKSEGGAT